jgi:hypothetical protein
VGFYFTDRGGELLAERLHGSRWHVQSTPLLPGADDISPPAVACPARSNCTAAGGYENDGPGSITLTERWNGRHTNRRTTRSPRMTTDSRGNGACPPGMGATRNNTSRLDPFSATSLARIATRTHLSSLVGRWPEVPLCAPR